MNAILADPQKTRLHYGEVKQLYQSLKEHEDKYAKIQARFQDLAESAIAAHNSLLEVWTTDRVIKGLPETLKKTLPAQEQRLDALTTLLNATVDEWAEFPMGRGPEPSNANARKVKDVAGQLASVYRPFQDLRFWGTADAREKFNRARLEESKRLETLVAYWNDEFLDVAVGTYIRRHIREAVSRADDVGKGREQQDKRDVLLREIEGLVEERDSLLEQLIEESSDIKVELAKELVIVLEKLEQKVEERERTEATIRSSVRESGELLRRLELPLRDDER